MRCRRYLLFYAWWYITTFHTSAFRWPRRIILVGMPGVGKTKLAKHYHAFTKTPFFDTQGNTLNREKEYQLLHDLVENQLAFIISTGENPLDMEWLSSRQDVLVIHVRRQNSITDTSSSELEKKRLPIYHSLCDAFYENNSSPNHFISWMVQHFCSESIQ